MSVTNSVKLPTKIYKNSRLGGIFCVWTFLLKVLFAIGESCGDIEAKAHSFLTDLRLFHTDKKVLVAAHGMWLMCMWRILSGSTVEEWYQRRESRNTFRNASVLSYACTDGATLDCLLDNYVPWEGRM